MGDLVAGEDDLTEQIDWERLLNDHTLEFDHSTFFDDINFCDDSAGQLSNPSDNPVYLDEIDKFLMNDDAIYRVDDVADPNHEVSNCLFSDILLDSPVESNESGGEVVELSDGGQKSSSPEVENNNNNATDDGAEDDPIYKKRKRQEKNRDAALRSRERKKLYVKDLEMKSRYFEGECKRLGMLFNCVIAENQALRLSLNSSKAFDASMTKQESAVLLLESLLLGSLLCFLGTICLLILPEPLRSTKVEVPLKNVDNQNQRSLARRKAGSKIFELRVFHSSVMGKRCKASRSRMKPSSLIPEVLVRLVGWKGARHENFLLLLFSQVSFSFPYFIVLVMCFRGKWEDPSGP